MRFSRLVRFVSLRLSLSLLLGLGLAACDGDGDDPGTPDAGPTADAGPDDHRPQGSFQTPADKQALREQFDVAVATDDDDGVVQVQLFLDQELVDERQFAPYEFVIDTRRFAEGAHELKAIVRDTAGQTGSAILKLDFDNTPPTIGFNGQSSTFTPATLHFVAADNLGLAGVTIEGAGQVDSSTSRPSTSPGRAAASTRA